MVFRSHVRSNALMRLASFGRAEGRAKRRRVEAPRAARETREALEEQVHDLLQEGVVIRVGMVPPRGL